jgi:Peptidase M61 N-terminal domain
VPLPRAVPLAEPQDKAYPGLITLAVDITDLDHRALHVTESLPVDRPGEMVLLFPKWLPGNHAPTGPLAGLSGLSFRAGGRSLAWTRDPVEMFAFHVTPPEGATRIRRL